MRIPTLLTGKTLWLSTLVLAIGTFALRWLEYQYVTGYMPLQIYGVVLATAFTAMGLWLGHHVFASHTTPAFQQNQAAIHSLNLSPRELDVLTLLAGGCSNPEIASRLFIANSTVKTHLVHIYQKLNVSRRTQAVQRARQLRIIP